MLNDSRLWLSNTICQVDAGWPNGMVGGWRNGFCVPIVAAWILLSLKGNSK